jgi:hypothetical protein
VLFQDGRGEDFDLEGAVGEVLENDRVVVRGDCGLHVG